MAFGFSTHDVVRRRSYAPAEIGASPALSRQLLIEADELIRNWLELVGFSARVETVAPADTGTLSQLVEQAKSIKLFSQGGVPVRNFVALALINHYLHPRCYLESGYYRGSTIFAAFFNSRLEQVIGFDPEPRNFRLKEAPSGVSLDLRQHDFGECEGVGLPPDEMLVYFDDHINTARRVIEAAEKGFKHLIFDDSCGLNGSMQRLWPSMPTLFFIQRHDQIPAGEWIRWSHAQDGLSLRTLAKKLIGRPTRSNLECQFDDELLELCRQAHDRIATVSKVPDLSDYVAEHVHRGVETTQHLVILK